MGLNAQDLSKHQWKERLVLVIAKNKDNKNFQKQLAELQNHQNGLKDRKLVIYRILPKKYSIGFREENRNNSNELYQNYKDEERDFSVILIGLDGGEKLIQNEMLSAEKLFNTIDSMPMRQSVKTDNFNNRIKT